VKNRVFCVVTLCSLETARCFRGTHQLHFLGKIVSQVRNQLKQVKMQARARLCEFTSCLNVPAFASFLLGLLFHSEGGDDVFF
jgi:hypothetical protein